MDENELPLSSIGVNGGEGKYSPRKLGSMTLVDGSFEALMKERSKVSFISCPLHIDSHHYFL
jgi:hypothetical protein